MSSGISFILCEQWQLYCSCQSTWTYMFYTFTAIYIQNHKRIWKVYGKKIGLSFLNSVIVHMLQITCHLGYCLHIHVLLHCKNQVLLNLYIYVLNMFLYNSIYHFRYWYCSCQSVFFFLPSLMFFHKHIWPSLNIQVQSQTVTDISNYFFSWWI